MWFFAWKRFGLPASAQLGLAVSTVQAGYRWRSARIVLTSTDPHYRIKVEGIKKILSELGRDEAFFSIDEYGPFAVKKKGGVKRVAPGQEYVVPQRQKSKGWLILTAALELSAKQVTHFYSRTRDTDEMIKMAELLRTQYRACRTVYLWWDAASWHIFKKLSAYLKELNKHAEPDGYPLYRDRSTSRRSTIFECNRVRIQRNGEGYHPQQRLPFRGGAKDLENGARAKRISRRAKLQRPAVWVAGEVPPLNDNRTNPEPSDLATCKRKLPSVLFPYDVLWGP